MNPAAGETALHSSPTSAEEAKSSKDWTPTEQAKPAPAQPVGQQPGDQRRLCRLREADPGAGQQEGDHEKHPAARSNREQRVGGDVQARSAGERDPPPGSVDPVPTREGHHRGEQIVSGVDQVASEVAAASERPCP